MTGSHHHFSWRAVTSVVAMIAFLALAVTGAVLFIAPPGRIANWTNWTVLGLRKSQWSDLHICFGTLFVVAAVVHLVFNWRPLVGYFKDRLSRRIGLRREWVTALALCALVFAGTRAGVPPFSTWLAWNEYLRQSWDTPRQRAPIPHAELLTLAELAAKAGLDFPTVAPRLEARGICGFAPDTVVQKLADQAGLSAQQLYEIITAPETCSDRRGMGQGAGRGGAGKGPGRMTLAEYCGGAGVTVRDALARLSAKGIKAAESQTLREIATNNGYESPHDLLEIIGGR
ncbi:MAG: DUF4405 domain-containing protein [Verrucomicrobiae bacterium]|nr:DUF4405 domain-containing protein [Verrucomicrobiae bacterium]